MWRPTHDSSGAEELADGSQLGRFASSRVSKRELQDQLAALQNDVAELSDTLNKSAVQPLSRKRVEQQVKDALDADASYANQGDGKFDATTGSFGSGQLLPPPPQAKSFNDHLADVKDNDCRPTLAASSSNYIDIPEGASTLLSQLARCQKALQTMTVERDDLLKQLGEERERSRCVAHCVLS